MAPDEGLFSRVQMHEARAGREPLTRLALSRRSTLSHKGSGKGSADHDYLSDAQDMMTLRQVEVIRAVMVTGTIGGAAKLLNVSAPGISRLVKYTERSLGIRFFQRQNGRYFPTPEAQNIFEQINGVYKKVDDLSEIISKIGRGGLSELRIGSVPSISQVMVPRAIERVRRRYPDLGIDINILKLEEAIDYLLLGRGECVAMSYRLEHSGIDDRAAACERARRDDAAAQIEQRVEIGDARRRRVFHKRFVVVNRAAEKLRVGVNDVEIVYFEKIRLRR
jgi:DNA-binding transcriptional LysR family regulator